MKKIISLVLVFCLALGLAAGCGPQPTPTKTPVEKSPAAKELKFAMITDVGGLGDKSFNDSAHRGLVKAEKDLSAKIKVLESRAMTDYEVNLRELGRLRYSLIFAVGFLMTDSVGKVAPKYPNIHFAIIDTEVKEPNVASCVFKEEEGSFLAGVLAALMSKKGKVGFIGGQKAPLIERFEAGYRAGVKTVNPKMEVIVKYTGNFEDQAKGKDAADIIFGQGADIIYHASGKCGLGLFESVKKMPDGYYAIGVDSDQDDEVKGKVLTSMVKRVDVAVFNLCKMEKEGKFEGKTYTYGLKEDGVGLSEMKNTKDKIPAEYLKKVDLLKQMVIDGKLKIPRSLAELEKFEAPKIDAKEGPATKSPSPKTP